MEDYPNVSGYNTLAFNNTMKCLQEEASISSTYINHDVLLKRGSKIEFNN
jgi:hypothetical protein